MSRARVTLERVRCIRGSERPCRQLADMRGTPEAASFSSTQRTANYVIEMWPVRNPGTRSRQSRRIQIEPERGGNRNLAQVIRSQFQWHEPSEGHVAVIRGGGAFAAQERCAASTAAPRRFTGSGRSCANEKPCASTPNSQMNLSRHIVNSDASTECRQRLDKKSGDMERVPLFRSLRRGCVGQLTPCNE